MRFTVHCRSMPSSAYEPRATVHHPVLTYFRSGWAFLIPYLAVYLLYAWLRWPVNAVGIESMELRATSWVPPLLHLYWFLHGAHFLLGGLALRVWWRNSCARNSP